MRLIILTLFLTLSLFAKEKVALVIGNKNYTNQTGLKNPIRDAKLIRDTLDDMGFEVLEAYDKNLNVLSDKLDLFIRKARDAKVAVVYYAGHGIGVGSSNYLIPIGASNLSVDNLGRKLMNVNELKGAVAEASGFGVVFFDACRNSFFSGSIAGLSSGRASRALVRPSVRRGQNILVSFSTKAGRIAKDDVNSGDHSPYALALRDNLRSNDDIRLVMGGIKESVESLTKYEQEPIYEASLGRKKFCLAGCTNREQEVKVVEKIVYRERVVEPTSKPISTSKWITPTNSVCRANGGNINKYGVCVAEWNEAKQICSASGGRLPTKEELAKVVTDCGGSLGAWGDKDGVSLADKNTDNSHYQNCHKEKGFSTYDAYWSSTTHANSSDVAWFVHFNGGIQNYDFKNYYYYVRCVRAGE